MAGQLKEAAKLMELLGEDTFKIRAFNNAVRSIENYEGDIEELLFADRLTEIKGIGNSIAAELAGLKDGDEIELLLELNQRVPPGVRGLFLVSGLGVKKIKALWANGIDSLEELIMASNDGRLLAMKGFSSKSADKFSAAAEFVLNASRRMRLDEASQIAELIIDQINSGFGKKVAFAAGSYRRKLETIGDIDIVIKDLSCQELTEYLETFLQIVESKKDRISARYSERDISFLCAPALQFAWLYLLETGNNDYRQMLLARAKEQGLELRNGQLLKDSKSVIVRSEAEALEYLGLPYIIPERREFANPKKIENIIELKDIKGLVHNHSNWSDGVAGIREMVAAARARGFNYLAMADHSKTSYYANGLSRERVYAQAREIAEIRRELAEEGSDFGLLHGIEVDIMTDGSLDFDDELLASLDYVVASVHQNFSLSQDKQTERIIKAISNPYVSILGHLSGRLLLRRPAYDIDQEAIIEASAETGTVIEINAHPARLDMDWRMAIIAKEKGCKFSINPDAHETNGFDVLKYGVMMARKAGLTKADIVNSAQKAEDFLAVLK